MFLAGVDDGSVRRLTWWGVSTTRVLGWTDEPDSRVLVSSHYGQSSARDTVVRAVRDDGRAEDIRVGPGRGVAVHPHGARVVSTTGGRAPSDWKRYRGGTAPQLWIDRAGDESWQRLLETDTASLVDPIWIGDTLVFVSDRAARFPDQVDAQADLWALEVLGEAGEPRRLTERTPDQGYVRDASSDGRRIIWHSRGEIWLLDGLDGPPRRVEFELPGAVPAPFPAKSSQALTSVFPDHTGSASLVSWRGATIHLPHRAGPAHSLVADAAIRTREPRFLGATGRAVLISDADGDDRLEVHHLDGSATPEVVPTGPLGRVLHLASDPAGERVATISHDGTVRLITVADGSAQVIANSGEGEALTPVFSPDGRYLAWTQPTFGESQLHQVMLLDTRDSTEPVALTSGKVHDHSPAFTRDGAHLVFLSDRTFDPEYDQHEFGLSFAGSTRPWLIPLEATTAAPFGPSVDGWGFGDPTGTSGSAGDEPPMSPEVDVAGAEERIVPFPVVSGHYRDLRSVQGGVLWVAEAREAGQLGTRRAGVDGDPATDRLEFYSFTERRVTTIADAASKFEVSGDGTRVVIRHKDEVNVQRADRKPDEDDPNTKVTVDLTRLRFDVDPRASWRQMFDENARIMRDHFWREDMDGVDWEAVTQRWRPVVDRLATQDDFVDLIWETVGELNTSHAYVTAPPGTETTSRKLGHLGADLSRTDEGWRIDRILPGDSSEPASRSPLRQAGVGAVEGDLVVAVGGVPVDPQTGPSGLLAGTADKPVELTLRRDGSDRRVAVVPLPSEDVLRYQDWVRSRRQYVVDHSGDRLGYLHIPDMQSYGWAQLHRDLRLATRAEGIIADVRYNRGGHTSQLVMARLTRRIVGWSRARHYQTVSSYPHQAPRGPVVMVTNRHAGSDGDIVNAAAQAYGIGPVVGERTWGGVVGIDGRFDLADGTAITQPRYAFWLQGKDYGVENYGVEPDIEVVHSPSDFYSDADPQLDRAIAEALAQLDRSPAATPPDLPAPKVR